MGSTAALGHPQPDHDGGNDPVGGNQTYWSGDVDSPEAVDADDPPMQSLATATDVPFARPPSAIESWNANALSRLEETGIDESRYPLGAATNQGRFLEEVAVDVFAISPSTIVHGTGSDRSQFVGRSGAVGVWVDYRVDLPVKQRTANSTSTWSVEDHRIEQVRLQVDGDDVDATAGDHTSRLEFETESSEGGDALELSVVAEVSATVVNTTTETQQRCRSIANESRCWNQTTVSRRRHTESVTVETTESVRVYAPQVDARVVTTDDDRGVVVRTTQPVASVAVGQQTAKTGWRFFTARDRRWDSLVVGTSQGATTIGAPVHPLQVHAYPAPRREDADESTSRPKLPVHVDLTAGRVSDTDPPPTALYLDDEPRSVDDVEAAGLVRGSETVVRPSAERTLTPTTLDISQVGIEGGEVALHVQLTTLDGSPVSTRDSTGSVSVDGERYQTNESGAFIAQVPVGSGPVTVRYDAPEWLSRAARYESTSQTVQLADEPLARDPGSFVLSAVVTVGGLLILLGGITGRSLWPPWRGL